MKLANNGRNLWVVKTKENLNKLKSKEKNTQIYILNDVKEIMYYKLGAPHFSVSYCILAAFRL